MMIINGKSRNVKKNKKFKTRKISKEQILTKYKEESNI